MDRSPLRVFVFVTLDSSVEFKCMANYSMVNEQPASAVSTCV